MNEKKPKNYVIEYESKYLEDVKDLLVELEKYILTIDKDKLDRLQHDYREKMAILDLEKVENLEDSLKANTENFSIYFNTMLDNGIVVPPSQFEAHFLSIAHTKKELDRTLEVMEMAFKKIGEKNA